jgi:hypothetical protein
MRKAKNEFEDHFSSSPSDELDFRYTELEFKPR